MNLRTVCLWLSSLVIALVDQLVKRVFVPAWGWPVWWNEGISFSLRMGDSFQTLIIFVVLVAIASMVWREDHLRGSVFSGAAWVGIVGGALGNLVDRLIGEGMVIDYIAIAKFPVFNFADICISIGVGALLLHLYLLDKVQK